MPVHKVKGGTSLESQVRHTAAKVQRRKHRNRHGRYMQADIKESRNIMQTVKIQSIDNTIFSRVFLGDKKLEGVREVTFNQSIETIPCFTFETTGLPDIEIDNPDIRFRFTPETVTDAAKVICHTYKIDSDFMNAFIASIESAIYDDGTICDISNQHSLAVEIANRIIGVEKRQTV